MEIRKVIGNKNIITNIYRVQANHSIMRGYFSISAVAFLVDIQTGLTSSATGLNICAITAWVKRPKSIIKKREEKTWLNSFASKI